MRRGKRCEIDRVPVLNHLPAVAVQEAEAGAAAAAVHAAAGGASAGVVGGSAQ